MAKIGYFFRSIIWKYIVKFILFVKNYLDKKIFSSYKSTIGFTVALIGTALLLIQTYIVVFNHSVYNNNSDDILQYYVILEGFIRSVKEGSLSLFDLNNYFGASLFSNLYYVPLDIFTFITLIFSLIFPTVLAISLTEMVKIVAGVVLVMIYLSLKKYSTRTIFWVGLIYFVNGGSVSFMNFPAFLTMTVYLPLALIVIHYFFEKKYFVVPLYVVLVVFYNFYLAYMLLAFISFAYIIEYFKFHKFQIKTFLFKGFSFLLLILLGVVMSSVVLLPSITFISEETARGVATFKPWIIDLKFVELKLFDLQVYIRYFAKLYSPQRPVSFRGFLGDYKLEHVSNYMTIIGFVMMLLVFFMRDKKSRVYQVMFGFLFIFMVFPVFSSLFSGTYIMEMFGGGEQAAYPYNRWLNVVALLEVLVIAHVLETYRFKTFKSWQMLVVGVPVLALGIYLVIYYGKNLEDETGFVLDSLTYDRRLMIVSLVVLLLALIIVLFKKYRLLKILIFAEVVVAVGYIFASGFGSYNRITEFKTANKINEFLNDNIDEDQFTRVYVDMYNIDNVEDYNFNQMISFPTNTRVFHSWTDSETDYLGHLIFKSYTSTVFERQSKNDMNYFSYYLSAFLGYRYVLTQPIDALYDDSSGFELIVSNENYALYKINNIDSFYVYDSYMTYEEFHELKNDYDQIAAERAFLKAVLIDRDRYQDTYDFDDFILDHVSDEVVEYETEAGDVYPSRPLAFSSIVSRTTINNPDQYSTYYLYNDFNIDYQSGEVALRNSAFSQSDYGEAFYINETGEEKSCNITDDGVIHCGQFFSPVVEIYIEKTDNLVLAPTFEMRLERAIEGRSYLVYDLSDLQSDLNGKIINFSFANYDLEKNFIVDDLGEEIGSINGIYISPENMKRIYIYKTAEIYAADREGKINLFTGLKLEYEAFEPVDDDLIVDKDIVKDKFLTIDGGKIDLSYEYIAPSSKNHIVVIPVTYSDDWQFTSDVIYDKISVSGGFLGIVIPEGTDSVDIQLKFVPKNLDKGVLLSLTSSLVFIGLVSFPLLMKKFKRGENNDESKIDSTSI